MKDEKIHFIPHPSSFDSMAVIKSINAPPTLSPFSMKDIEAQAHAILQRARAQAQLLISDAQQQGETIRTKAHADGMAEGLKEGLARGSEQGRQSGHEAALAQHQARLADLVSALSAASTALD